MLLFYPKGKSSDKYKMETIEYTLKSNPERSVMVPEDYAANAESLVNIAVREPTKFANAASELPYLSNPGILERVMSLINDPQSLDLQDEVYLRVCVYGNEEKMKGPDREEALEIDRGLIQTISQFEFQ